MKFAVALIGPVLIAGATGTAWAQAPAGGNAAAGTTVFQRCMACHKVGPGAKNGLGPALNGVVGRKAAAAPGYTYSPALAGSKLVWNDATLSQFLTAPAKLVPGTKMVMSFPKPQDRADVIAYLKQFKADGSKK